MLCQLNEHKENNNMLARHSGTVYPACPRTAMGEKSAVVHLGQMDVASLVEANPSNIYVQDIRRKLLMSLSSAAKCLSLLWNCLGSLTSTSVAVVSKFVSLCS